MKDYPYGRARILAYAESQGCPIPADYARRASDLLEFLDEAESLALTKTYRKKLKGGINK